jgi:hypothetical protein
MHKRNSNSSVVELQGDVNALLDNDNDEEFYIDDDIQSLICMKTCVRLEKLPFKLDCML